jgi:hypothetical protein
VLEPLALAEEQMVQVVALDVLAFEIERFRKCEAFWRDSTDIPALSHQFVLTCCYGRAAARHGRPPEHVFHLPACDPLREKLANIALI